MLLVKPSVWQRYALPNSSLGKMIKSLSLHFTGKPQRINTSL
jgi:hypothetical protein